MTAPSFENWLIVLSSWVFAPRRTVTGMIVAASAVGHKHHSAYHRLFATAPWSRDRLGLAVFDLLEPLLGNVVFLGLDDRSRDTPPASALAIIVAKRSAAGASWASQSRKEGVGMEYLWRTASLPGRLVGSPCGSGGTIGRQVEGHVYLGYHGRLPRGNRSQPGKE